jgi:hypothetical protein
MDRIDAHEFLVQLQGQPLETLTGKPNRILRVTPDHVVVATNKSPEGKPVPIEWIQDALDRLIHEGMVTINVDSVGYRSAFVGAVLSRVPGAIVGNGSIRIAS